MTRETYSKEGWAALNRAARALRYAHASGRAETISLARDVFHYVLRRVNRDCTIKVADGVSEQETK